MAAVEEIKKWKRIADMMKLTIAARSDTYHIAKNLP